uniref:Uncharacterized protein LOC108053583 n=1 Tax=Drosophila rhopaloa TaxID=1041015 RepID=A0A6P4G2M2_DRORH
MKNNLWETLQEVDKVEVSFEKTLRNIKSIQNRYKMVSALKKKDERRQESFEAEIQAAITENKITKLPKKNIVKKKNKTTMVTKQRVRKGKAISKGPILPPIQTSENVLKIEEPFVCLETNCVYEIHKTTTHVVTRKPYGALIRRLYRAARRKNRQEETLPQENYQEIYPEFPNLACSCSSCCLECR